MDHMPDFEYLTVQSRRRFPYSQISVFYPEDEVIHILIDGRLFVFEIGSDDDAYVFTNRTEAFEIPLLD